MTQGCGNGSDLSQSASGPHVVFPSLWISLLLNAPWSHSGIIRIHLVYASSLQAPCMLQSTNPCLMQGNLCAQLEVFRAGPTAPSRKSTLKFKIIIISYLVFFSQTQHTPSHTLFLVCTHATTVRTTLYTTCAGTAQLPLRTMGKAAWGICRSRESTTRHVTPSQLPLTKESDRGQQKRHLQ